jgi:hypothetical protein
VQKSIFGANRDEIIVGWRTLKRENLHKQFSSSNIIRMVKSRRLKSARHITRMGTKRIAHKVLFE